jgi:hypothetical protein
MRPAPVRGPGEQFARWGGPGPFLVTGWDSHTIADPTLADDLCVPEEPLLLPDFRRDRSAVASLSAPEIVEIGG